MPKPAQSATRQAAAGLLIGVLVTSPFAIAYAYARRDAPRAVAVAPLEPVAAQPAPLPAMPATPPPVPTVPAPTPAPAAPPVAAALSPPAELVRASVEFVDCTEAGAPSWCRQVRAAHDRERRGTVVAIVRSPTPGDVFACSNGRHIGQIHPGGYTSRSLVKKLGAVLVDRVPRGSASSNSYYVRPEASGLADPAWMSPCP